MSSPKQFNTTMREWAESFMHRSMREWSRYVKSSGLSMPQFSILMKIYHRGGCGISDISQHLDVTNAAASQLVDKMVGMGLLDRAEDPKDRRAKQVTLSNKGRSLLEKGAEARNRWVEDLATHLTAQQRDEVISALKLLLDASRALDTPKP